MRTQPRRRSRSADRAPEIPDDVKQKMEDLQKEIPEESMDVIKTMPENIRIRLLRLYVQGTIKPTDLGRRALHDLNALQPNLMNKVVAYCEYDHAFFANSRSKSGFLVSVCARAKRGELDPRGFGAMDPWKMHIQAMINSKDDEVILEPEEEWKEKVDGNVQVTVDVSKAQPQMPQLQLDIPVTTTILGLQHKLKEQGISWPINKMKFRHGVMGWLKPQYSLAYYNFEVANNKLELVLKARGNGHRPRICALAK